MYSKALIQRSFTLIEILIVIGVLGVLVVTVLVILNPQEGQRKTRDAKRMKDLNTLSSIVRQWNNAGNPRLCPGWCWSHSGPNINRGEQPCDNNWLRQNVCQFSRTVPADPLNNQVRRVVGYGTPDNPVYGNVRLRYGVYTYDGGGYIIIALQESGSNVANVTGGLYPNWWVDIDRR